MVPVSQRRRFLQGFEGFVGSEYEDDEQKVLDEPAFFIYPGKQKKIG